MEPTEPKQIIVFSGANVIVNVTRTATELTVEPRPAKYVEGDDMIILGDMGNGRVDQSVIITMPEDQANEWVVNVDADGGTILVNGSERTRLRVASLRIRNATVTGNFIELTNFDRQLTGSGGGTAYLELDNVITPKVEPSELCELQLHGRAGVVIRCAPQNRGGLTVRRCDIQPKQVDLRGGGTLQQEYFSSGDTSQVVAGPSAPLEL